MPHIAWRQVRTMAIVFACVSLAQLVLSFALLGLRPGPGSTWLIVFQVVLMLAFVALAVYADRQLRAAVGEGPGNPRRA